MVKTTQYMLRCVSWWVVAAAIAPAYAAEIQTKLSHTQVYIGESMQVEFSGQQGDFENIDFAPLKKDFEVGGVSRRSSVSIANGVREARATVAVNLIPKRLGNISIPALSFGKAKSQAAVVRVIAQQTQAGAPQTIFMQLLAEPQAVYVQQQVKVRMLVWMDQSLNVRGTLSNLTTDKNAIIKQVKKSVTYKASHQGRGYNIHEDVYLVYPQSSGSLEIRPVNLTGSYVKLGTNRNIAVRKASNKVVLNVKPIPDSFTGVTWLPAREVKLTETWSKDLGSVQAGTSVLRSVTISARDLLGAQLPDISIGNIRNTNVYPEQAQVHEQLDQQISHKTRKFIIIPSDEGRYTIPELRVPWWDVSKNRIAYAVLPAKTMVVSPAPAGLVVEQPPELVQEIQHAAKADANHLWQWISGVLLLILLLSVAGNWKTWQLWLASRQQERQDYERKEGKQLSLRKASKKLQTLCAGDDLHAIKAALLDWARVIWEQQTPGTLVDIAQRVDDENLALELQKLDQALYGEQGDWNAGSLGVALQAYSERPDISPETKQEEKASRLEKLFRL